MHVMLPRRRRAESSLRCRRGRRGTGTAQDALAAQDGVWQVTRTAHACAARFIRITLKYIGYNVRSAVNVNADLLSAIALLIVAIRQRQTRKSKGPARRLSPMLSD